MPIPARILRAQADELPGQQPVFSARDLATQDRILKTVEALASRHGCAGLTLGNVAAALRMSPTTVRRHFCDLPSIIAEIFLRHLRAISDAIGQVSCDAENLHPARRTAYAHATRCHYGGFTDLHALFLAEHHRLPPDLAEPLETFHATIGHLLGATGGVAAITLLDTPGLEPPQIETILAALAPIKTPAETIAAPQPTPPPLRIRNAQPAPPLEPAIPAPPSRPHPQIPALFARDGPEESLAHIVMAQAANPVARTA